MIYCENKSCFEVIFLINEYLFQSDERREEIETFSSEEVSVEFANIENTNLWIALFSLKGNQLKDAKKLSDIHNKLMKFSPAPQVLSCESSEYFNKALYPKINILERKLRKLLYIAASLSDDTKCNESIKRLEEKDFGTIFDLLFIDSEFIKISKQRINADSKSSYSGMDRFTKSEILDFLNNLKENTLWDSLMNSNDVPSLRKNFRNIKNYRNDVMHAHNIDKKMYGKADYIFDKVNAELDEAIGRKIGNVEEGKTSNKDKPEFNDIITSALKTLELEKINENLMAVFEQISSIGQKVHLDEWSKAFEILKKTMETVTVSTEYIQQIPNILSPLNDFISTVQEPSTTYLLTENNKDNDMEEL